MRFLMFLACCLLFWGEARADELPPSSYDPETQVVVHVILDYEWPNAQTHFKLTPPEGLEEAKATIAEFIRRTRRYDLIIVYCAVAPELRHRLNVDMENDEAAPGGYIGRKTGNCTVELPPTAADP